MINDPFFDRAERDYLTPPEDRLPHFCPACGSIDISADGYCRHCGTNIEESEITVEIDVLRPSTARN